MDVRAEEAISKQAAGEFAAAYNRLFGQLDDLTTDTLESILSTVEEARAEIRQRLALLDTASASSLVQRQMEQALEQVAHQLTQRLTSTLATSTGQAAAVGVEVAGVGLPRVLAGVQFHLPPSTLEALGFYHATLVKDITDDIRSAISKQVQLGVTAGTPLPEIAKRIGLTGIRPIGVWKDAATRATVIATTEIQRVASMAQDARYKDAAERIPGLKKKWVATPGSRTRPSHREANGQVVPIHEPFTVGGHQAQFPLDPNLPARESIRCRCRMVAVLPDA